MRFLACEGFEEAKDRRSVRERRGEGTRGWNDARMRWGSIVTRSDAWY
jgi:hypothetical protein